MKWFPDGSSKQHARQAILKPGKRKEMTGARNDSPPHTLFSSSLLSCLPNPYWLPTQPIKQQTLLTPKQAFFLPRPCTTSI